MKYNPSDAARACNVSVNTVRGWIRDFGEHFTPGARGESGNRLLSDKDMNTLKYIASLRSEGLQRDAIAQRLQEVEIGEAETIEPLQEASIALAPPAPQETQHAAPPAIVGSEYLLRLEARLAAVEASGQAAQQSQRHAVFYVALGALGMGILFLLLIGLAVLYGGFR